MARGEPLGMTGEVGDRRVSASVVVPFPPSCSTPADCNVCASYSRVRLSDPCCHQSQRQNVPSLLVAAGWCCPTPLPASRMPGVVR